MGKIELDHTGSGSGITLSSDGTDLLLNGTAIGGGGAALELYAENPSSPTAPSATGTNAVAIGDGSQSTHINSTAFGAETRAVNNRAVALGWRAYASGNDAAAIATDDNSGSYGAKGGNSFAVGQQSLADASFATAIGRATTANSSYSTAIGMNSGNTGSQAVTGLAAMALGGSYASGADSFAAAIANNTSTYGATGANSVAIGQLAKASGANGLALGRDTEATATQAVAVGRNVVASGSFSAAFGTDSTASASYSTVIGHQGVSNIIGKIVFAGGYDFSANGDVQHGVFILRSDTTDATPEALTTNNSTAGADDQIILPNNSAYAFHGTIVARQQASAGTACAAWKIEGLIRREGSAGTTVLVNSATTVLDNTPSWGMALSADTTNGGLKIEVTGAAATNIRWVATVHTSEVTY